MARAIDCPETDGLCMNPHCSKTRCVAEAETRAREGAADYEALQLREAHILVDWVNSGVVDNFAAHDILLRHIDRMNRR